MQNKTLIIVFLIIAVVVMVVGFVFGRGAPKADPIQPTDIALPPAPNVKPVSGEGRLFRLPQNINIPTVLPGYSTKKNGFRELSGLASRAATAYGFVSSPSAVIRGGTTTLTWVVQGEAELVLTRSDKHASFLYRRVLIKTKPQITSAETAINAFLAPVVGAFKYQLQKETTSTQALTGLLLLDNPKPKRLTEYAYYYALNGYPVLDDALSKKSISVVVDEWGVIRFTNITAPPVVLQQTGGISLLTPGGVLAALEGGRAGVLHAYTPGSPEWGVLPSFTSFAVTKLTVVYAPRGEMLLPAFLIEGTGTDKSGVSQGLLLFMWAFPGN